MSTRERGTTEADGEPTTVHLINHTHWDREWFLTHEYTTAWIPSLIDSLQERASANTGYEYLFDGQTLVIEDLLGIVPGYRSRVEELIGKRTLRIGPLYSQPDWRLISGQLHVRNLANGIGDASEFGGDADVVWLVDTFGHISQAPQLLAQAGIDAGYVWRGVPAMHPVFDWVGADGSALTTVDLFGGYRNLYGVTKTPDIAIDRLVAETRKLEPYYGDTPIPLFDGYDLDTEPEDPVAYYGSIGGVPDDIDIVASSPRTYIDAVTATDSPLPTIRGELLSGRFGATFPGTLSTRTYLKILHHDAEVALHRRAEPLAVMAALCGADYPAEVFERADRELLQNGVHDCICGVSIDQVHERMDRSYRRLIGELGDSVRESLATVMGRFAPGRYAVSTSTLPGPSVGGFRLRVGDELATVDLSGVEIRPVIDRSPVERVGESVPEYSWGNEHYELTVDDGGVRVDGRSAFIPVVRADRGDTYSSEPGEVLGVVEPTGGPVIESRSSHDAVIVLDLGFSGRTTAAAPDAGSAEQAIEVLATLRLRVDDGPVIEAVLDLDTDGTGYRLDIETDTGVSSDRVIAGMPFDLVERPHVDTDLEPHDLEPDLAGVLMGQREVEGVDEFPFHHLAAFRTPGRTVAMMARGNRSYRSTPEGLIGVALRRSVEWLALSGLHRRSGDAGPAMYVPGARCERSVRHELALAVLPRPVSATELYGLADRFVNPPLIVDHGAVGGSDAPTGDGADGIREWRLLDEHLPLTGVEMVGGVPVARLFNPDTVDGKLRTTRDRRSPLGRVLGSVDRVGPKEIVAFAFDAAAPPRPTPAEIPADGPEPRVHGLPEVRVGASRSVPVDAVMERMETRRAGLLADLAGVRAAQARAEGSERYRLTHREYVLDREAAELALSLELNRRLAASRSVVSIPDEADPEIARLGLELNELRINRRIYDYVVQSM